MKLKRIILILSLLLSVSLLVGCFAQNGTTPGTDGGENDPSYDGEDNDGDQSTDLGQDGSDSGNGSVTPLPGKISKGTIFSNGIAFVACENKEGFVYGIDKSGNVVFEVLLRDGYSFDDFRDNNYNGTNINYNFIVNNKGEVIYAEDIGATAFYCNEKFFEAGYIFATRITSDFASAKKELGVLNAQYEWVIEPSEELYNDVPTGSISYSGVYDDGCFYAYKRSSWGMYYYAKIDVKTGEVSEIENEGALTASAITAKSLKAKYPTYTSHTSFVNGKAAISFYNSEVMSYYVSLMDENAELLFAPIEVDTRLGSVSIQTDGRYLFVHTDSGNVFDTVRNYDGCGNKVAELEVNKTFSDLVYYGVSFNLSDNIIRVSGRDYIGYYDINFNLILNNR